MGQKVHPVSFRLGAIRDWNSRWYATKDKVASNVLEDYKIRKIIAKELASAMVSKVDIERTSKRIRVIIFSGRPGLIIGRQGAQIESLKSNIQDIVGEENKLVVDIKEVANPAMDSKLIADNIALQLEKRAAFRKVIKKAMQAVKDAGGEGMKVRIGGRLGGAEIARVESFKFGKVPLQTVRADIDYGFSEARTTFGLIGIKVWLYKGEKFGRTVGEDKDAQSKNKEKVTNGSDAKKS
ncbi:MAG TPA: 30S ribosomal protein S3 [Candidatus Omnitrophota bacterium]|nr:30S ribosomal protein S3 [Candidatus Omnitrophota bacterium]HPS20236.1 30S ribosomal protein S3 [Candidatus Omnitrophota bacterium]